MLVINKFVDRVRQISTKQLVVAGAFSIGLAASIGLGMSVRGNLSAAIIRDTNQANSIDNSNNNGGIGAADANELIKDINDGGVPDLKGIYTHFGMDPTEYNRFLQTAKPGMAKTNGQIIVDGQVVMDQAWSIGRTKFSYSTAYPISGVGTYYKSMHTSVLKQDLPVMVMFDANGNVEFVVMNACGNTVEGIRVNSSATCKALVANQPDKTKKPNTYVFTTDAAFTGNAKLSRVVYTVTEEGETAKTFEKKSLTDGVEYTFKKKGHVKVAVYAAVPGGKEVVAKVIDCEKNIEYVPPFYFCTALVPSVLDQTKRNFRFTVKTKTDSTGATTLKDADFSLDGAAGTKQDGKDGEGNLYKEYKFTDTKTHKVVATVNFNTAEGVKSVTCEASVTPNELPKCTVPGKEHLPPDSPLCGYCRENIPVGDARCNPPELVHTGPGGMVGLFAGTSVLGALGHRIFMSRRARKNNA